MIHQKAREIMNRSVVSFKPDTDIYEAVKTFLKHRFSGAPVVDDEYRVVGVVSEKDCLRVLAGEAWDGLPEGTVGDYMSQPAATIGPEVDVAYIVGRFLSEPYRRLPVVDDDGKLLGQVSRRDVLRAIESMDDNSYLYGVQGHRPNLEEGGGVHSAMQKARQL